MGIPILGDVIDAVKDLVSEVVVDKDKRDQINLELIKIQDQAQARLDEQVTAQIEVNKIEANSGSVFVAGWRPFIGWVGGVALAYSFIVAPFLGIWFKVPEFQYDDLITIVLAMLGIGGMRSFEKVKGVSTNDFRDVPKAPSTKTEPQRPTLPDNQPTSSTPKKKPYRWQKI